MCDEYTERRRNAFRRALEADAVREQTDDEETTTIVVPLSFERLEPNKRTAKVLVR